MPEIILHHYPLSPYSEKIRLLFGLKNVNWRSVEVPIWTPRPLLSPMTGGFGQIPIMQIGADFYCDTLLISNVVEKLYPVPSLYPSGRQGVVNAVSWWIEEGLVHECPPPDGRRHSGTYTGGVGRGAQIIF